MHQLGVANGMSPPGYLVDNKRVDLYWTFNLWPLKALYDFSHLFLLQPHGTVILDLEIREIRQKEATYLARGHTAGPRYGRDLNPGSRTSEYLPFTSVLCLPHSSSPGFPLPGSSLMILWVPGATSLYHRFSSSGQRAYGPCSSSEVMLSG